MKTIEEWARYYNAEVDKMNALDAEYHLLLSARGAGKSHWQLEKAKEVMENGGHILMANNKGFLEMTDELLMDSGETVRKLIGKEMDEMILAAVERGDMHIDLCKTADAIHQNAVAHGWWEEERDVDEVKALIHSEWSEALEEARAERPLEWYACKHGDRICDPNLECPLALYRVEDCPIRIAKPEGIAVELIDGVIRILDWMASQYDDPDSDEWAVFKECMDTAGADVHMIYGVNVKDMKASKLVNALHDFTSMAIGSETAEQYGIVVGAVFEWIRAQGMEPEAILMRKHRYNTTRPYKHGKKF